MAISYVDKFLTGNERVTATLMGDIVELQYMEKRNHEPSIRKIDKFSYELLKTGEIKKFNLSETRKDNINSLRQTFKKLAYLVNANFSGKPNEFWITLTYAEKQYDYKEVSKDYDRFLKRMRYQFRAWGGLEAIRVLEPHADGSWHVHVLMKFPERKKAYIANERLSEVWGNGFVTIDHIKQTDNVGAYLTAYLTDMSLEEVGICYNTDGNGGLMIDSNQQTNELVKDLMQREGVEGISLTKTDESKAVVKGGRLSFYPVNMKMYTTTRGICQPDRIEIDYDYAKEIYGLEDNHLTIRRSLKIEDIENDYENILVIEQYNRKVDNSDSILMKLNTYKEQLEPYYCGRLAEDWLFTFLEKQVYELEHRFEILKQTREYKQEEKQRRKNLRVV